MLLSDLSTKVHGSVQGRIDWPPEALCNGANRFRHLAEGGGSHHHQIHIAACCGRSAGKGSVNERIVDALRQGQEGSLKLGCYSCSFVDQPLQLRKARMGRICAVVDQVCMAALLDYTCSQEWQELAP